MADPISATLAISAASGSLGFGGLTTLGTISTVGSYTLLAGAAVGGSLAINALKDKQRVDNQLTVKQPCPARQRIYGRALVAGAYFFFAADYGRLVSGWVLCEGPIDGIQQIRFDNNSVQNPADSGPAISPWEGQAYYGYQYGYENQTRQDLIAEVFPGWWGTNRRLQGLATLTLVCTTPDDPEKYFSKYFPSGVPSMLTLLRGAMVSDPRNGSVSWTRNASCIILDYLVHPRGMNIPVSRIDLASFAAFADVCQNKYAIDGAYQLDEPPKDVLARMLQCCDGEIYPVGNGTIGIRGGTWTEPTVTITPDMITGIEIQRGAGKMAAFNQLRIRITDPASDWQTNEIAPWNDLAAQVAAGGEIRIQQLDLPMVVSYAQARRLAKIFMAKGNPLVVLNITTNAAGLNAFGERTVRVIFPDFGVTNDSFFVNHSDLLADGNGCALSLASLGPEAYGFAPDEEGPPPVVPTPPPPAYVPPVPAGLVLTSEQTMVGASKIGVIKASVTPPANKTLGLVAQYRLQGTTAWLAMPTVDTATYTARTGYIADGIYEVRAAFKTFGSLQGAWSATQTIAFTSGALGPIASALAAGISMDWGLVTEPVSSKDDFGLITEAAEITIDMGTLVG